MKLRYSITVCYVHFTKYGQCTPIIIGWGSQPTINLIKPSKVYKLSPSCLFGPSASLSSSVFQYKILICHLFTAVRECRSDVLGKDYKGTTKVTKTGKKCQRWDKQTPHKHTNNKAKLFPDSSLAEASNYCRNPDNEPKGPWCYTEDSGKRWEYCDIKICSGNLCSQFEAVNVLSV